MHTAYKPQQTTSEWSERRKHSIFYILVPPRTPLDHQNRGGGWDVDEPNFEQLVLEAQKELDKSLQNLAPAGKVFIVHQRRVPGTVWEVLNYALKQGRKMNTNVQNYNWSPEFPPGAQNVPLEVLSLSALPT